MKRVIKIEILGHPWTVRVLTKAVFERRFNKSTLAICIGYKKTIYLCSTEISFETVCHELTHAFFSEMGTNSASLSGEQLEEVACDLVSKYGGRILELAGRVMYSK